MKNILFVLASLVVITSCSKKTAQVIEDTSVSSTTDVMDQSWRSERPQPAAARPIEIGEYQSFDLENGLKVIVVENHKLPRVSYQLSLKNDPIAEGEKAGYVSMAGSLIPTGTKSKSKAELDAAIDYIGANISAGGRGMFGSSLTKHQEKMLDIMTEMLYEPSFPEAEFDKLKKQTLSNLSTAKTDPNSIASNVAQVLNYGKDHPYGEITTEKTVDAIAIEDCKTYYDTYFRPNNAFLVIVGDISLAEAKIKANQYFSTWEPKPVPSSEYVTPQPPSSNQVAFANKDGAVQSVIRITYPLMLKPGADDVIKTRVLNTILGGGVFAGRLMQNLREDKGYTYGAGSSLSSDNLMGRFNASASVRNEVTDSSVVEFLYELERITSEPVTQEDLQLAKNSISGAFARSLESPQTIARFALNTYRYNIEPSYYNTYLEKLDAISIQDVKDAAVKYIKPNSAHILVVGNKDETAEKLLTFDADGQIDFYDPYGNEVKYDDVAMDASITPETVISDYIEAIGGKELLMSVTSMKTEMGMSIMGQNANVEIKQKKPGMMSMGIFMQGMTVQDQRFDGETLYTEQMGQTNTITEGPQLEAMKEQAILFPQLTYDVASLELKGIEEIDGKKAYKMIRTTSSGDKVTEFYDISNSLLIRTIGSQDGPQGKITVTTDFGDYKEVGGILFPHKTTIAGAFPQPMVMTTNNISLNLPIPNTDFMK